MRENSKRKQFLNILLASIVLASLVFIVRGNPSVLGIEESELKESSIASSQVTHKTTVVPPVNKNLTIFTLEENKIINVITKMDGSKQQVVVTFAKPVDSAAISPDHYTIWEECSNKVARADANPHNAKEVILTLRYNFLTKGTSYNIVVAEFLGQNGKTTYLATSYDFTVKTSDINDSAKKDASTDPITCDDC